MQSDCKKEGAFLDASGMKEYSTSEKGKGLSIATVPSFFITGKVYFCGK